MIKVKSNTKEIPVKFWTFPAGEVGVKVEDTTAVLVAKTLTITLIFDGSNDIITLLMLVDALRSTNTQAEIELFIPYFPYARQDRICAEGEAFSLRVFCDIIKSVGFKRIKTCDLHSSVTAGMFPAGMLTEISQKTMFISRFQLDKNMALVAPDNGSVKKTQELAKHYSLPVLEFTKVRDVETGNIIATKATEDINTFVYNHGITQFVVVDDICDGGRTFIEIAKVIKQEQPNIKLHLRVSHGIFSKGKEELLEYYDTVQSVYDLSN